MVLGSLVGIGAGIAQDVISFYKEKRKTESDFKIWKQKQEMLLEFEEKKISANAGATKLAIEMEEQKGITNQTMANIEHVKNDAKWYESITKANSYIQETSLVAAIANFIIGTTRPIISYVLIFFLIQIYYTQIVNQPSWLADFVESIVYLTDTVIAFWFYRRGSEKLEKTDFKFKKKI